MTLLTSCAVRTAESEKLSFHVKKTMDQCFSRSETFRGRQTPDED